MLFRKKIEQSCLYCRYSTKLSEDLMLCAKKGIVAVCDDCRKFRYDPFRRVPAKPKALDFSKYDEDDFSL
jgi:hypothetical protein